MSVSFSPDGATLASASEDETVRLWDVNSGTQLKTFQGHTLAVNSVSFSPKSGKHLASASSDKTVVVLNPQGNVDLKMDFTVHCILGDTTGLLLGGSNFVGAQGLTNSQLRLIEQRGGTIDDDDTDNTNEKMEEKLNDNSNKSERLDGDIDIVYQNDDKIGDNETDNTNEKDDEKEENSKQTDVKPNVYLNDDEQEENKEDTEKQQQWIRPMEERLDEEEENENDNRDTPPDRSCCGDGCCTVM